eukprot:188139_1
MKNKISNSQLDIIDLLYPNNNNNSFKKYVALGPLILDELFNEYCHYHKNFKYMLYDPRDFALLDQFFNYQQLWYLNKNDEYNFKEWFNTKSPHFIKLFCADKGTKELYKIIKEKKKYNNNKQVKLKDIIDAKLIISDKGTKELYKIIKEKKKYNNNKQVKLKDIIDAKLIISDKGTKEL